MTTHFLIKKAFIFVISLTMVITLTFFLMHLIPGDPFMEEQMISEEILKAMHHDYGLDKPLIMQYFYYLKGLFHLDLGFSFKYQGRPVAQIISEAFPISFALGIQALLIALGGGLIGGSIASLYHRKWQDQAILAFLALCLSVPAFLSATLFQYLFAMQLDLFPVARWGSFSHTILPSLALALFPFAYLARLARTNIIEVLQQDYIVTARSKGLSQWEILYKHVLKNALLPVVAYLGPLIAAVFMGSFVIEKIFGIPGLGQWLVTSIGNRDYPLIMGLAIFYSFLLMGFNFLVDCVYYLLDPRIKKGESNG